MIELPWKIVLTKLPEIRSILLSIKSNKYFVKGECFGKISLLLVKNNKPCFWGRNKIADKALISAWKSFFKIKMCDQISKWITSFLLYWCSFVFFVCIDNVSWTNAINCLLIVKYPVYWYILVTLVWAAPYCPILWHAMASPVIIGHVKKSMKLPLSNRLSSSR